MSNSGKITKKKEISKRLAFPKINITKKVLFYDGKIQILTSMYIKKTFFLWTTKSLFFCR